jgi:hypothetical protein
MGSYERFKFKLYFRLKDVLQEFSLLTLGT